MSKDKDTEIRSKYDDYSVDELKAALNAIFDSTDEFSDSQVEEMERIMAVLTKKNPLPHRYTAEASWKIFQETYSEELSRIGIRNTEEVMEEEPEATTVKLPEAVMVETPEEAAPIQKRGYRKLLHTALVAAAVIAAMVIITVSAAAAGINIWGWVPVWNNGTFQFVSEEAISSTSIDIPTALKQLGIREPMFPTWLPEGFVLYDQQIHLEDPIILYASYVYKDQTVIITIRELSDRSKTGKIEMDDVNPIEYEKYGTTHYILTNLDAVVGTWYIDDYLVRISGNLTVENLERIIDSIYEVVK